MRMLRLFKRDLAHEMLQWRDESLISPAQFSQLCARYDIDPDEITQSPLGYRLLIFLGYLFIGLSLITLIGANWQEIPRGMRLVGLVLLTSGTHAWGIRYFLKDAKFESRALFFLGNLFFGASIVLIAQMYHLGEHMPDGVFWWAMGSLPFALLTRSSGLMLQSMFLALIWFFIEVFNGYFPVSLALFIAAAVYVLTVAKANIPLCLLVISAIIFWLQALLGWWWYDDFYFVEYDVDMALATLYFFVLVYTAGQWLGRQADGKAVQYSVIIKLWMLRFAVISLLLFTGEGVWEALIEYDWPNLPSVLLIAVFTMAVALLSSKGTEKFRPMVATCAAVVVLPLLTLFVSNAEYAVWFQVLANIIAVVAGIMLIMRGISSGVSHYYFSGIITLLLIALIRYFDLVGDYVTGAALFLCFALIVLGAARVWKTVLQQQGEADE
uniref:DUF2157 domain-containing protein n=1 Tax=Thaumasiovibrio occultus TaxID=1891184 RepID=UPI00131D5EB2|nr:DUF2157 domain-containing protein [Thaumasiovibrio occultus]